MGFGDFSRELSTIDVPSELTGETFILRKHELTSVCLFVAFLCACVSACVNHGFNICITNTLDFQSQG